MADWSERYPYAEDDVRAHAPNSGGVYRLINQDGEKYYVFYVGQSDDLERRLLEHLSSGEPNACIRRYLRDHSCFFRSMEVASQSERDRIEQEQIDEYSPACND